MKTIRILYIPPLGPLVQDLERVFPEYAPLNAAKLDALGGILINRQKKRFVYVQEFRNEAGTRTHVIVYARVRNSFIVPAWIQGQVLGPADLAQYPVRFHFMGHEQDTDDDPNEEPEEEIT